MSVHSIKYVFCHSTYSTGHGVCNSSGRVDTLGMLPVTHLAKTVCFVVYGPMQKLNISLTRNFQFCDLINIR
ncbi:Putative protein [Zobellia galactanivorans]|uniref:Uncharacterized protein n=1 Tax=Zobellia galactanivorans (strain DSM 12802 / CCUG 47099 / CIP 106680 / NCIMB 13871 / Dsij) TaxID=63186 RepID=G0L8C3_ZOBGA|nr:Putative protein [Zobellia galactanivorans]